MSDEYKWRFERDADDGIHVRHAHVWGPSLSISTSQQSEKVFQEMMLIAAAPDLLEALQEARAEVAYIASGMSHSLFKTNAAKCCLARIDKAIAKATQGEPNDPIQR